VLDRIREGLPEAPEEEIEKDVGEAINAIRNKS